MKFKTDYSYIDRKTKAKYVWLKYREILKGKILDVGADECYLRSFLPNETKYIGIGLGGNPDFEVNLEKEKIPFKDFSFDVVLCIDVLEHLDNLHEIFDELCRVSKKYVIVSLPNCYAVFVKYLKKVIYKEEQNQHIKFYGLPFEKIHDRHKWFFSIEEAERFIQYRSKKNNMEIIQIDIAKDRIPKVSSIFKKLLFSFISKEFPNLTLSNRNLYADGLWAVLKKRL